MKRITQLLLLGIIPFFMLILSGCSEGEQGIFATIAIEEKIKKNNLVDNASISGMVKSTFNGTERYVVVAGTKVFTRPVLGSDWDEVSSPSGRLAQFVAGRYLSPTAGLGGDEPSSPVDEVYAVFQSSSNSDKTEVYRLGSDLRWTEVLYSPLNTYIDGMIGIDNVVFISNHDGTLLAWSGEIGKDTPAIINGFNDGVRDGVRAGADGADFFLVGKSVFLAQIDSGLTSDAVQFVTGTYRPQPRGIGYSDYDGGILAVADLRGYVYVAQVSGTPQSGPGAWKLTGDVGRPASDVMWVSNLNGGNGAFLIGTVSDPVQNESGRGYYEGTITGSNGDYSMSTTRDLGNNYKGSDLTVSSIRQFRHFGYGAVFALTDGLGLWSTTYPDSAHPKWRWE